MAVGRRRWRLVYDGDNAISALHLDHTVCRAAPERAFVVVVVLCRAAISTQRRRRRLTFDVMRRRRHRARQAVASDANP